MIKNIPVFYKDNVPYRIDTDSLAIATISDLITVTASKYEDKIAVKYEDQQLTYKELEIRSNKLAYRLRKMGVGPGKLIGIYIERSLDMMVALLGTLKAGAAYIPLDPAYPADRISYMLEDSGSRLVLTKSALVDSLHNYSGETLCLDSDWQAINQELETSVPQIAEAKDLAYVIYTSGSTGRPKGVEVPHRAVLNFLYSMRQTPGINENDRLLAVTTLSFDIAGLELYLPLTVGAQVVIASRTSAVDGNLLGRMIEDLGITVMQATPATWRLLLDSKWTGSSKLRVFCGGESLSSELAEQLLPRCAELWNLYGPTETTIWSTVCRIEDARSPISIGYPIANTEIQILDDKLQPVETGAPGELYIGGMGLACGYHKREDLTKERFIPHPLKPNERLYRTGDLARHLPDGSLEHMGRIDYQVKVRGFRIELGEIESALNQLPIVKQAVVLAREDVPGEKRLVAYVIYQSSQQSTSKVLREALAATLPDYMVPGFYVTMDTFPLTPNGKIDRNAFPVPESGRPELATEYLAPRNDKESTLVDIWSKVLRIDNIGVNDNFFDLGGDSLKVAQVATRIRDDFGVDVALRLIFENSTIAGLAQAITGSGAKKLNDLPFRKVPRDGYIPLTFAQERVWFLHQLNPNNLAYNFISTIAFNGHLDVKALEKSLGEILRRHESYRTTFPTVAGRPGQIIHPAPDYKLNIIDLSDKHPDEQERVTDTWSQEEYQHRFDLTQLPLVRWTLFRYSGMKNVLVHMEHHLVHDGWAFNLFIRELVALYNAYAAGKSSPLDEPPIQLAEFATWQHDWMQGAISDYQLAYWKKKFGTIPPILELPTKDARPPIQTFRGTSLRPEIPLDICNRLRALSKKEGSTFFMTMLAGFVALLHRYTGESDIAIGTFFANRRKVESESVIGMILNNVVIRTTLDKDPTIRDLIHQVRNIVLEDASYQDVPFDRVVEAVQPQRDLSMNPLFQVMFSFHDEPMPESGMTNLDVSLTPVISNGSSKFDLGVIGIPHSAQKLGLPQGSENDGLTMIWEHNTDLFDTSTIARMVEHYKMLLRAMVSDPDQHLSQIVLSDENERERMLISWNNTAADLESGLTLHGLVEKTYKLTPEAVAIVFESEEVTYRQLIQQSNQLANYLMHKGIQPNALVGLCVDRSPRMLVAMLAIMKAGAAYIPIDPKFPHERQSFILKDAGVSFLITEGNLCANLFTEKITLINFDIDAGAINSENVEMHKAVKVDTESLAYVIYTSGSTGMPKGVQIPHRAIVNLLCSMRKKPGLSADDQLLAVTTLSFDIAGLELYLPLTVGARVIICPRSVASNGEELTGLLEKTGATMMQATPTTWQLLIDTGWKGSKNIIALCGGEAFPSSLAEQLLPLVKELWNMYGPTETTVWSTIYKVESVDGAIPIGRPIDNTEIFLLDQYNNIVPPGIIGELCIGGLGLSCGYLNRPELTSEKFINNPIKEEAGDKIFKTGDLARYKADGTLECLGRIDHQIKLRGFRIELGEIESLIEKLNGIKQSVVIAREDIPGDKRLVAYVVVSDESARNSNQIIAQLKNHLPDYMLPSICVFLDTMPLTPNGKIDRKTLPVPSGQERIGKSNSYVAPRNDLEITLVGIWEKILGVSPIGVRDDFFDVGGHSLLAVRLTSKIEEEIGKRISLAALLQGRTIEYVASTLIGDDKNIALSSFIPHRTTGGKIPFFAAGSHPKYAEIPQRLGEDQPFYQLDLYALLTERMEKGLKPFTCIEEFAEYYIQQILDVCPHGPYNLGGGCEGAYLAYEMAVRLQEMGHEIGALVMWIPPALRESKGLSLRRFAIFLSLERLRYLITNGSLSKSNWHALRVLAKHELLEYRINQALCSYAPSKHFHGKITLIRTSESPFVSRVDINRPWIDRATEGGSVHIVKGNHGNWLYNNLDDFVDIIDKGLGNNHTKRY
ncbi:MAG: amino acid adenylation domain-containing protein [Nitrosomonas sp.]|nr:amino acid adenylation domain-containing protein [Nitrosomonas sp.]